MDGLNKFGKGAKKTHKDGGRAVIYQRVSSKEQETGYSPETQLERCYEWADRHHYEVVECFKGEHESAKSDVNRKRFNAMLEFVKDKGNRIDAVIVYSTSRFSRAGTSSFSIVDELESKGITVYSATSSYDAKTADGKMMQGMELLMANHDNTIKSQAVRDNGARALRSGRWIDKRLFTYKRYPLHHLSYDEELYYPKMPLPFRLRVAFMIMCSWKGLRFFILMWLLSYGIVMFMKLKEIKLPKISSKVAKWCIPLAFVISLIVYAIAMKPSEQYTVDESGNVSVDVISKAKIPSFLGETHHYFPYDTILSYRGYPTYTPTRNEGLHCPKMPLLFRLRVALMIMYSWEGLRFFILMWLLSYGIVMFIKSKTQFNLKD